MSQAEELLKSLSETATVHHHPVTDSDTYYIIDPITRKVDNRSSRKNTIMQRDHNSERFTFECPRYIEGHDMSLCNATKVHYVNIDSATNEEKVGAYEVDDISLKSDDENSVICTWLISRNATQLVGPLQFWIQYACVENGDTVYEWYTDMNEDIEIKKTRNNVDDIIEDYPDVLEQLKNEIISETGGGTVKSVNGVAPDEEGNIALYNSYDAVELAAEMGFISPVTDENGDILTDGDGAIFTL